jgi:hypothetical protein
MPWRHWLVGKVRFGAIAKHVFFAFRRIWQVVDRFGWKPRLSAMVNRMLRPLYALVVESP